MVCYSKDLSHFHQKSWKVMRKEQYQQDGHHLEKVKNPEDAFILLLLLAASTNRLLWFGCRLDCSYKLLSSKSLWWQILADDPGGGSFMKHYVLGLLFFQWRAIAKEKKFKRQAELPRSPHGLGDTKSQFGDCLQKPP